jgi:cytochrome c oxidase assembly factor CtaG
MYVCVYIYTHTYMYNYYICGIQFTSVHLCVYVYLRARREVLSEQAPVMEGTIFETGFLCLALAVLELTW